MDEEYVHHRDEAMVSPWTECGIPMPPPPARGRSAPECPDCLAVMNSRCRQQHD